MKNVLFLMILISSSSCNFHQDKSKVNPKIPKEATKTGSYLVEIDSAFSDGSYLRIVRKNAKTYAYWGKDVFNDSIDLENLLPDGVRPYFPIRWKDDNFICLVQGYGTGAHTDVLFPIRKNAGLLVIPQSFMYDLKNNVVFVLGYKSNNFVLDVVNILTHNKSSHILHGINEIEHVNVNMLVDTIYRVGKDKLNLILRNGNQKVHYQVEKVNFE